MLFRLIPFEPQQSFETYYVEIEPGKVFQGEPHEGNVYEYVFVIKGKFQIFVEGKIFKINEGERIQIPGKTIFSIEHEREGHTEEVEFQFKWER